MPFGTAVAWPRSQIQRSEKRWQIGEDRMDTAVALVQAYLNVNGYFTVVEYPVLEASRGGHARSVTDLDILALRFAGAGHDVIRGRRTST